MPVVSSQFHSREVRSVQVISETGVLNPDPNAASNFRYGQFGFWLAGMGLSAVTSTPSRKPDMFSEEEDVPDTLCASVDDALKAAVRILSARWLEPLVCVWVASAVYPAGRNACPEEMLSPPVAPMKNDALGGALRDSPSEVTAAP